MGKMRGFSLENESRTWAAAGRGTHRGLKSWLGTRPPRASDIEPTAYLEDRWVVKVVWQGGEQKGVVLQTVRWIVERAFA